MESTLLKFFTTTNSYDYKNELINKKIKSILGRFYQISEIHKQEFFVLIRIEY